MVTSDFRPDVEMWPFNSCTMKICIISLSALLSTLGCRIRNHHTAKPTGNHMPYGITHCYLPPGSDDFPATAFTPDEADTRFSDPGGLQS